MVYPSLTQTTLATTTTFTNYNENFIQHPDSAFAESLQTEHEKVNYYNLVLYIEYIKNSSPMLGLFYVELLFFFVGFC